MLMPYLRPLAIVVAVASTFCVSRTAMSAEVTGLEKLKTAWGEILIDGPYASTLGAKDAKQRRLVLPDALPQVISARALSETDPSYLPIHINKDATEIAVVAPEDEEVVFDLSEATQQTIAGDIFFIAKDATVHGKQARLESHPGNYRIGFWTNADDYVSWNYEATRWGRYRVLLTYSTASPDGSEIEVEFGGDKLAGKLESTGSWYTYHTIELGELYLAQEGLQTLSVRCVKKVGGAVMNLKAVILKPTCEGENPTQNDDGTVLLHGRDATVIGVRLRYEPSRKKQTLGYWTNPRDAARWDFELACGGTFDVEVLQGCGTGQGGSDMALSMGQQEIAFTVEETGHFQNFKPRVVGRIQLDPGEHWLKIHPKRIAKTAACDIRQIRLIPVNENE